MKLTQLSIQIDTDKPTETYLFAHDEGQTRPIGLLKLGIDEEATGWISSVFVEESFRGKGVGRQLLERAFALCRELNKRFVSLAVANKNEKAQRLYKSLGFLPFMTGQEGYMQYIKPL